MDELRPGTAVDGYRVERLLACGAMGEVYLALDEQLGRRVALKLLRPSGADAEALKRFLDEARTTARFAHPHIVTLYAVGTHGHRPYLALEYLDGETLRERHQRAPMAQREVLRACATVAEAVAEAHRHGVVHADLKPENVVVPRDGRLRVVDFGLARLSGGAATSASGTPAYMAPERWAAGPPTSAIDVWALGVILHELLAGVRPLRDAELADFAFAPREVPLAPTVAAHPVADVVRACLSPSPQRRPSAAEVAQRLQGLLAPGAGPAGAERSPFRGLDAFSEADAGDFFGRDAETDAAVEVLRRAPLVPVLGPSGVGKSSFVFAGLLPRLRDAGRWAVVSFRPGRRPCWSLAAALAAASEPQVGAAPSHALFVPSAEAVEVTAQQLEARPGALTGMLGRLAQTTGGRVLLFVDQLEELFTLAPPEAALPLVRALASASSPEAPWRTVVALRDDFFGAFAALEPLQASLGAVQVLGPLGKAALESAVAGPLRRVGYAADDEGLPARVAAALQGQAAALPLLQFACAALWDRRDVARRLVLLAEYEAMGGATGALAENAQRFLAELAPHEQALTRELLLRLVTADGTRRPRTRIDALGGLPAGAASALDRLVQRRLVVSGRCEDTGEALVELAHESLVTTWPPLSRWLAETHEARQQLQDLEQAASLWDKRGRRPEETWAGDASEQAQERTARWKTGLTPLQAGFLAAGVSRERQRLRRRRGALAATFAVLTLGAGAATAAAVVFRDQELHTRAQQEALLLAAADMGEFDLVLAPFDWDPAARRAVPVPAAALPGLQWALYTPDPRSPNRPGRRYEPGTDLRSHLQRADGDGARRQHVEARGGAAFLVVSGRGRAGATCGDSEVRLLRLPGYRDRPRRGAPRGTLRIPVPTCAATRAGTVAVPAGPYWRPARGDEPQDSQRQVDLPAYAIDATEVTRAQYGVYAGLAPLTGDELVDVPEEVAMATPGLPAVWVDAFGAERFCRFLGKQLPSLDEWSKAFRGGLSLPGGLANPEPLRRMPWVGARGPAPANVAGGAGPSAPAEAGAFFEDQSPYGVLDLAGNVSEWTRESTAPAGLRVVLGGSWALSALEHTLDVGFGMVRFPEARDFATGLRCVALPAATAPADAGSSAGPPSARPSSG